MKNYTFCETIQSIFWDIVNYSLSIRYNVLKNSVNYNKLYSDISKRWNKISSDLLKSKDNWVIVNEGNWGSARPDNISVSSPKNINLIGDNSVTITNQREISGITGKDWDGNPVTRYYSSGSLSTKELFTPKNKRFSLWCELTPGLSTWPAFWLFYADERNIPNEEKDYFEIDGFERFPDEHKLVFTVHWGKSEARKMYNRSVRYHGDTISFLNCIALENGKIKVYVNNILVFVTSLGFPQEDLPLSCIISDSVNNDEGELSEDEINNELPIFFRSKDFIIWEKRN